MRLIKHLPASVPQKYHQILTPNYGVGCKRRIFDESWFPCLSHPKVELIQSSKTQLLPDGIIVDETRELRADIIVMANGFDMTTWLHSLNVVGQDGQRLHDVWQERGGPQAYMGTAMDGFPNFLMIHGPNVATGHSSIILQSENMVHYALKFIKMVLAGNVKQFEVKKSAEMEYTADIREFQPAFSDREIK